MCKRFIDCGIWRQPWYLELTAEQKVIWNYLTLQCDSAGLWKIEPYQLKKDTGIECRLDSFIEAVNSDYDENFNKVQVERIIFLPGKKKLWITGFISFQYEKGTNGVNGSIPAIKGALNRLNAEGILQSAIDKGFIRVHNYNILNIQSSGCQPLATDKDKDKDKDKDCSSVLKEEGGAGEETRTGEFQSEHYFREWWKKLPNSGELKLADELLEKFGKQLFVYALKQSVEYKTYKIAYLRSICKSQTQKAAAEKAKEEARRKQEELNKIVEQQKKENKPWNLVADAFGAADKSAP